MDPLLNDLTDKKQAFRRNVVSLTSELKDVRIRLASKEDSFAREMLCRKEAEEKVLKLKEDMCGLHKCLEEANLKLESSTCPREEYCDELNSIKSQLSEALEIAKISAESAEYAKHQCLEMHKELSEKIISSRENKDNVVSLAAQFGILQRDIQTREGSQMQLRDEISRVEHDLKLAVTRAGGMKEIEVREILQENSSSNLEKINKFMIVKDEEMARLRDEIRMLSSQWKLKTIEFESQIESHTKLQSEEMKKKVLKLEFCLHETRAVVRKLQRREEKQERVIKKLKDKWTEKKCFEGSGGEQKMFWESSGFKIFVSLSMVILVVFSKR